MTLIAPHMMLLDQVNAPGLSVRNRTKCPITIFVDELIAVDQNAQVSTLL